MKLRLARIRRVAGLRALDQPSTVKSGRSWTWLPSGLRASKANERQEKGKADPSRSQT